MSEHDWAQLESALNETPDGSVVAVSVRDLESGRRFDRNGDALLPAASTIKVLILVALARAIDEGRLALDHPLPTPATARVGGSGVLNWLAPDLQLSVRDHAWLMIAISDNTASNVLIDAVGIPAIAGTGRDLGLRGTTLARRFLGRLPDPGMPDNLAGASDLTLILEAIATGTAASASQCAWMLELLAAQQYQDRIGRSLPDAVAYAGKTGSLSGIVHDCGVLTGPGGRAAIAVLTQGIDVSYAAEELIGRIARATAQDLGLAREAGS